MVSEVKMFNQTHYERNDLIGWIAFEVCNVKTCELFMSTNVSKRFDPRVMEREECIGINRGLPTMIRRGQLYYLSVDLHGLTIFYITRSDYYVNFFLGSDTLLQMLYETDKQQETHDILTLHEVPAVWRYRAMISVNHLRQSLDVTKLRLPVLRLFLREVVYNATHLI